MAARDVLTLWKFSQENEEQAYRKMCYALKCVQKTNLIHVALQWTESIDRHTKWCHVTLFQSAESLN